MEATKETKQSISQEGAKPALPNQNSTKAPPPAPQAGTPTSPPLPLRPEVQTQSGTLAEQGNFWVTPFSSDFQNLFASPLGIILLFLVGSVGFVFRHWLKDKFLGNKASPETGKPINHIERNLVVGDIVMGDKIQGDKIGGDVVHGDKITIKVKK